MNWEDLLKIVERIANRLPVEWNRKAILRCAELQDQARHREAWSNADKRWLAHDLFALLDQALPKGYLTAEEGVMVCLFRERSRHWASR